MQNSRKRELELKERSSRSLLANVLDIEDDFRQHRASSAANNSFLSAAAGPGPGSGGPEEPATIHACLSSHRELASILRELRYITDRMKHEDAVGDIIAEWKYAAMVVDRLCLIVFTSSPSSLPSSVSSPPPIWLRSDHSPSWNVPGGPIILLMTGSTTQWQADLAPKEMAASDMRNRHHVQPLLTSGKDEVTSPDVRECLISMISTHLEETKKIRLLTCLNEFADIFDFEKKSFPVSGEIKHKIDTSDYPPVRQRPYRVSPAERRVIQSEVEKMMETKIIRPSSSPWASPVILVRKKDGSLRFCVDYRRLNKITKKDVYPLPRIDDALDTLSGSRYFSTMDMRSGYWQIEVDDKDREKTAFITPDGLYEFNVMPFGLCNAPATFERMIDNVLRGLKWDMCLCYLDDIVIYGSTFKEHLTRLYKVLRCIQQAGLCLNYKKCHFASRQITILGHVVNEFGTQPDPEKVKAIVHFPKPRNIRDQKFSWVKFIL
ncbi:K02A2.6-like [Cordylochernes scorpioides]|uniref:K02A2.6-like n=1 Tax=Cordylochernes scorpioides TaxID=51811 RepID=A0ABY6LSD6_9ARAC|nr:K02A2.6-like [Cordylochernes scorpioides]